MNEHDFIRAFEDVIGLVGEHQDVSGAMERMDLDVDGLLSAQSKAAVWLHERFNGTAHYPPQTAMDLMTALSAAFGFGALMALKAVENERYEQLTGEEPNG